MRTPNLSSVFYAPASVPVQPDQLRQYLEDELGKIASVISLLADGHLDTVHVAPTKPREGDIRLADGTNWNPGSGQGMYVYYGAAWHFLG